MVKLAGHQLKSDSDIFKGARRARSG